jgi:hypothetical protein
MNATLAIILFFIIAGIMGLLNGGYDKDRDDYMSGGDGNDHY